jgi:hypothetical protein
LDVAAHIGDAGKVQQTLYRAILAEFAMQNGEHQVQVDRLVFAVCQNKQAVYASVRGQHCRAAAAAFPVRVRAFAKLPSTVFRNADIERLILFGIEASCDLLRGLDRDGMFFGAAAEYDGDLQPIHAAFLRTRGN